jgi:DNA-binding response OmpR family regulator
METQAQDGICILIVDDDDITSDRIRKALPVQYQIQQVGDGKAALELITQHPPSLILLDVSMPGLTGYDVCKTLRNELALDDLPVLFVSSRVDEKSRLAGYEAGGDDYLTKPIVPDELCYKIDRLLKSYAERRRLQTDLTNTFSTAMAAMSTAGEVGAVLHFLRTSFNCLDYPSLCQELITTLGNYGLEASVQIRGQQGKTSLGSNGACSPLEESVLNHLFGHGRLFEFSSCMSCSYEHITIIVRNLERDDPEQRGRMRDNIALLAEGANVRITALDANSELAKQHIALTKLISNTTQALEDIEQQQRQQRLKSDEIFQRLQQTFDMRLISLGLTDSQENELTAMISNAVEASLALYDESLTTEQCMENILKQLHDPMA